MDGKWKTGTGPHADWSHEAAGGRGARRQGQFPSIGALRRFWRDVWDTVSLLKDRMAGRYPETPWRVLAALSVAAIYLLWPVDAFPDAIPLAGLLDDASVFALGLIFARRDLERYRVWKRSEEEIIEAEWTDVDGEG